MAMRLGYDAPLLAAIAGRLARAVMQDMRRHVGTSDALLENGSQTFWLRNPTAVVGRLVDGSLELQVEVPTTFGSVKVETTGVR